MPQTLSGLYFIDGIDIWTAFSMFVEKGTDDFLRYPAAKESITHDWINEDGIDADKSAVYFTDRQIDLRIGMITANIADFFVKYNLFLAQMKLPNLRRIEPKRLGERSYYCYYKECRDFTSFTKIAGADKIGIKFTVSFIETNPKLENENIFIVDDDNQFLIV